MAKGADKVAQEGAVQALFQFGYDDEIGVVERGQVFSLAGHINDSKLVGLRYVAPVQEGARLCECGDCGKLFAEESMREAHGDVWHSYECPGCGFVPSSSIADREASLERHMKKCEAVRDSAAADREQHHAVVTEVLKARAVA